MHVCVLDLFNDGLSSRTESERLINWFVHGGFKIIFSACGLLLFIVIRYDASNLTIK